MSAEPLISTPIREATGLTPPAFTMPAGACDSHVHVFGPEADYPHVQSPHYTLPDGPLPKLEAMCGALGLARFAIVQPSFYGTDNRCMLDALDRLGGGAGRARGVAMVDEDVGDAALADMHARGVRALRLDLFKRAQWPLAEMAAYIRRCEAKAKALGWHLQFYTPGYVVRSLIPLFAELQVDFVIDHMGYMLESDGLTRADFDRLLATLQAGRGWLKLSGPYRIAKDGHYAKLQPLAQAIVATLPDRTVWGSDWPHIPNGAMDTGMLLNLLAEWVPDEHARNRILADNPGRLYGFQ